LGILVALILEERDERERKYRTFTPEGQLPEGDRGSELSLDPPIGSLGLRAERCPAGSA